MRTIEVTREFYERTERLAMDARIPEVRQRLRRLADLYRSELEKLERVDSGSLAPE